LRYDKPAVKKKDQQNQKLGMIIKWRGALLPRFGAVCQRFRRLRRTARLNVRWRTNNILDARFFSPL
jgi:CRISPR/Cas system Type II protein with McrA/HNH and RuvC-like nuclease domain